MVRVAVFDAYGTLLDVNAAMRGYAARLGPEWERISLEWRTKHIEYTWVRSLAGRYRGFWALARESLTVVAARQGIADKALLNDILQAYRRLEAYPEVAGALRALKARGLRTGILSNGEPDMLAEAVGAAGLTELLDAVLSVDEIGVYKPDPRVYSLVTGHFGVQPAEAVFFSSNQWDAFGAREFGFRVFWVNRSGAPDEYGLRESVVQLRDLKDVEARKEFGMDKVV
ncbi:MAG: haloacid dehalogenase type II [Acetobacteraceae bacterium]|nr:haloacid dehalogenase type II [Acetobacteraceae bacterium]